MLITDAEKLARGLMDEYGLNDWSFGFDRALRRFGYCSFSYRRITLSRAITELNGEAEVLDSILHEIAHGLVGYQGYGALRHGPKWHAMAKAIGCSGEPTYGEHIKQPPLRYTATCPSCGEVAFSNNPPHEASCGQCSGETYNAEYKLVWTRTDGKPEPIKPKPTTYVATCPACSGQIRATPRKRTASVYCWASKDGRRWHFGADNDTDVDPDDGPKLSLVWTKAEPVASVAAA